MLKIAHAEALFCTTCNAVLLRKIAAIAVEDDTTALSAVLLLITAAIAVWDDATAVIAV